jgi:hypothetical protein
MGNQFLFLSCGLVGLGMIMAMIGGLAIRPALETRRWESTTGRVIDAPSPFRYTFDVDGRTYTASRIGFGLPDPTQGSRYSPGQEVTVYYSPSDPTRSALEPGPGPLAFAPLAVGGLFLLLGLIALLGAFL